MEMGKQAQAPMQEQGASTPEAQSGGASELVTRISSDMTKLAGVMDQSDVASPEDKAQMSALLQQFQDLVMGLGQAPGAAKPQAPAPKGGVGLVPAETGGKPASMGL